jgi:hypothetical protein
MRDGCVTHHRQYFQGVDGSDGCTPLCTCAPIGTKLYRWKILNQCMQPDKGLIKFKATHASIKLNQA